MELLNRAALIVTPRRRFLEWVNRLPDCGKPLTIEDAPSLRTVYLAATGDEVPPLADLIEIYWEEIFEESLDDWTHDESLWPVNRTSHVFRDWFQVDCIDGVVDADPDEPVTIHELARTRCTVCEADLTAEAIAIVACADTRVRRMTVQELDALETGATPEDDPARPLMVFRCCREQCAARMEESLSEARNTE
ncbi:MAG: hypothetical protein ACRD3C_21450 [Vicinamibacterales bacterium]